MMNKTRSMTVTVLNPQGLHARPADMLVRLAMRFQANVELVKDGEAVDGKSILSILMLGAEQGSEVSIRASGPDAEEAVAALAELFGNGFDENGHASHPEAAE